jgi:hypothetical protein
VNAAMTTSGETRLEITDADVGTGGSWTSPDIALSAGVTSGIYRLSLWPRLRNACLTSLTLGNTELNGWAVPSINADQFGETNLSAPTSSTTGMLMPPWPDDEHSWTFELRTTNDGTTYTAWAAIKLGEEVVTVTAKWYQVRVTMKSKRDPYRPALIRLDVVATN